MVEHRLIERMIAVMKGQLETMNATRAADIAFIDSAVDFIRTYADRCHHGKEEGILFRNLGRKPLSTEHKKVMAELVTEHAFGRNTTARLAQAGTRYAEGRLDALNIISGHVLTLVEFYPRHIEKEDRRFFVPAMEYFTPAEQQAMLAEMYEFDRGLIHERYEAVVAALENSDSPAR
jgi:hemerythrin-like domain-containing protein